MFSIFDLGDMCSLIDQPHLFTEFTPSKSSKSAQCLPPCFTLSAEFRMARSVLLG
ncbi:MAG: hypothetical protein UV38_C0002G0186 [candidate division TM6 bacterium GW2011_GWE2_42_60]|nr:MAG: hypothetical protein UV38_C0002G0186 [candidate division TM6 bacterium GW2011_GWE2_42_60]